MARSTSSIVDQGRALPEAIAMTVWLYEMKAMVRLVSCDGDRCERDIEISSETLARLTVQAVAAP